MQKIKSFVTSPLGICVVAVVGGLVALALASRVSFIGGLVTGNKPAAQ